MPSSNLCAYDGCSTNKKNYPDLSFHRFPREKKTCDEWIIRAKNVDPSVMSSRFIANARLCSRHFADEDFLRYGTNGKRVLRLGALPFETPRVSIIKAEDAEETCSISKTISENTLVCAPSTSSPSEDPDNFSRALEESTIARAQLSAYASQQSQEKILQLKRKVKMLRQKVKNCDRTIKRQIALRKKLSQVGLDTTKFNENQLAFFMMQVRHLKKCPWNDWEKRFALDLYNSSSSFYNYFRDDLQFALPCVTLIRSWINESNPNPNSSVISEE